MPRQLHVNILRYVALILVLACGSSTRAQTGDNSRTQAAPVRLLAYNTYNFMALEQPQIKSPESRIAVIETIAHINPDIMLLIEVGGRKAAEEIQNLLRERKREYDFLSVVDGDDQARNLVVLAKMTPVKVAHDVSAYYNLNGRHVKVSRGFAYCVFAWDNGYRLHLLGAHLKSKLFHPLGQTDMRRYEARQLRYRINDIIKEEPQANILVMGDFNDTPNSSPFKTVRGLRYKDTSKFFDLRPMDEHAMSWTYAWDEADTYSRIDYALASYHLLPEIDLSETKIPFFADWFIASDHRPLLVTLTPVDKPVSEDIFTHFEQNIRKAPTPMSSFNEGRVIGSRKVRR